MFSMFSYSHEFPPRTYKIARESCATNNAYFIFFIKRKSDAVSATNNNRGFYKNGKIIQKQIKKLN